MQTNIREPSYLYILFQNQQTFCERNKYDTEVQKVNERVFFRHRFYRSYTVPHNSGTFYSDVPKKSGKTENIKMHHAELEHWLDA